MTSKATVTGSGGYIDGRTCKAPGQAGLADRTANDRRWYCERQTPEA